MLEDVHHQSARDEAKELPRPQVAWFQEKNADRLHQVQHGRRPPQPSTQLQNLLRMSKAAPVDGGAVATTGAAAIECLEKRC